MSIIIPLEVKTREELDKALRLKRTVIIINNDELYNKICNRKKGDSYEKIVKAGGIELSPRAGWEVGKYETTVDTIHKKILLIKHKGASKFRKEDLIEGYSNAKCNSIKKAVHLKNVDDFTFYKKMKYACIIIDGDLYKEYKIAIYDKVVYLKDTKWIIDDTENMRFYMFHQFEFDMNKDKIADINTDELFLHKTVLNNRKIFMKEYET